MDEELLPDADDIPTPTVTNAERIADGVMALLAAIRERIPDLETPHPKTAPHVRGSRTVSREAVNTMIAAVEQRPELQALNTFDVDDARFMLQFNAAMTPVLEEVGRLQKSLSYTMEARKARVVASLLQTYEIAKALARTPEAAPLIPYIENLRRDLGRRNGSSKQRTDETEP